MGNVANGALAIAALVILGQVPGAAQEAPMANDVIVTATRFATPAEQVASAVTVIDDSDIERWQYRTLPEALKSVPGLNVVQQGPAGALTSLFARGTESNHTLVLIDGIEATDPSTPDGAFDFSNLLINNIERIEIVRGPQSTLYGSEALGAVVNIITKKGRGPFTAFGVVEGGSHTTFNQRAGFGGSGDGVHYNFSVAHLDTHGESVTPSRLRPAGSGDEDDGYESLSLAGRGGLELSETVELEFVGRYVQSEFDLDTGFEDPNARQEGEQAYLRGQARWIAFKGLADTVLGVSYTRHDRDTFDAPDFLSSAGSVADDMGAKLKIDLTSDIYAVDGHVVTFGLETEKEEVESRAFFSNGFSSRADADARTNAGFTQVHSEWADNVFTTLAVRIDDHDRFDEEVTYRLGATLTHPETGARLKLAYGSGFKAPTLDQLFGQRFFFPFGQIFNGNPNLRPETSEGFDIGIEQPLWTRRVTVGTTYFELDIEDLIAFNPTFTSLINVGSAETWGLESYLAVDAFEWARLRIDYTYTRSQDATSGADLLRRPNHKATASAELAPLKGVTAGVSVSFTGPRKDVDAVTFGRKRTPSYTLVNVAGAYDLSARWQVFGRVENLFDRNYEPADGFRGQGLTAIGGIKGTW